MFESVNFLNEGEQAEAYKARKAKEEADRKAKEEERIDRRYNNPNTGGGYTPNNPKYKEYENKKNKNVFDTLAHNARINSDNVDRSFAAAKVVDEDDERINRGKKEMSNKEFAYAADSQRRHDARHLYKHKNESSIFESVVFLNEENIFAKIKKSIKF